MCNQTPNHTQMTSLWIKGEHVCVDNCIAHIVSALNNAGIETTASCCGHGIGFGNISLKDGREFLIAPSYKFARDSEAVLGKLFNSIEERNEFKTIPSPSLGKAHT